jgi:hypothetical protein
VREEDENPVPQIIKKHSEEAGVTDSAIDESEDDNCSDLSCILADEMGMYY